MIFVFWNFVNSSDEFFEIIPDLIFFWLIPTRNHKFQSQIPMLLKYKSESNNSCKHRRPGSITRFSPKFIIPNEFHIAIQLPDE